MGGGIEGHWAPRREEIGTRSPADLSRAGVPLLGGSAGPDQSQPLDRDLENFEEGISDEQVRIWSTLLGQSPLGAQGPGQGLTCV